MNDNNRITDQDIDKYLNDETELSDIYANSKTLQAPEHLSSAVKRMARDAEQEISSGNHPVAGKNVWLIPLSLAATVLIAITIVFFVDMRKPDDQLTVSSTDDETIREIAPPTESKKTLPGPSSTQLTENKIDDEAAPEPVSPGLPEKQIALKPRADQPKNEKYQSLVPEQEKQTTIAKNKEATEFEIPPHLKELVQDTSATGSSDLLPDAVLKTWTKEQWQKHVRYLKKAGNEELADKYIKEYPKYFPGEKLEF